MKINLNSFLLILLLCPIFIFGQTSINGIVTDEISSSPIAGVNVLVKGSNTGTATDFDGNYSINLKKRIQPFSCQNTAPGLSSLK